MSPSEHKPRRLSIDLRRTLRTADRLKRRHPYGALVFLILGFLLLSFGALQVCRALLITLAPPELISHKDFQAFGQVADIQPIQPIALPSVIESGGWAGPRSLRPREASELRWNYLMDDKLVKYVGHQDWMQRSNDLSRAYFNSLAVVADYDDTHMHGKLAVLANGTTLWKPKPMPPPLKDHPEGTEVPLKNGGFYLALSDALPLDRVIPDNRDPVCLNVEYNRTEIGDASILITFYNEPLSTLLRTVHSVLNLTPPPMLREIILIDDHSDSAANRPGGPLDEYVRHLPKVKLMRMHERRGIVHARIAGAKAAQGSALVVLDSHVEVNPGWLEPQLARVTESPESIVFPQILGIATDTLEHRSTTGIGCHLSFRWVVVEQAELTGKVSKPDPIPSPSMAGGLFTVDRQFFWDIGGYDEEFVAWGAENVEMALRTWMCGGRVECTPCAKTYHIYRKGGAGYSNPVGALWRNRKRTARLWMDEHYQVASRLIDVSASHSSADSNLGSFDAMLDLKERLRCKNFSWYLENVEPEHDLQHLEDVIALGRLRNNDQCIDLAGQRAAGSPVRTYSCHEKAKVSANQGFLLIRGDDRVRLMSNDKRCLSLEGGNMTIQQCTDRRSPKWVIEELGFSGGEVDMRLKWSEASGEKCVVIAEKGFRLEDCDVAAATQKWKGDAFEPNDNFQLPDYSARKKLRRQRWEK